MKIKEVVIMNFVNCFIDQMIMEELFIVIVKMISVKIIIFVIFVKTATIEKINVKSVRISFQFNILVYDKVHINNFLNHLIYIVLKNL